MGDTSKISGLQLRSLITKGGELQLSLAKVDLLAGYADCFLVFAFLDQLREPGRTGHIRPLTQDHVDAGLLGEGL